MANFGFAFTLIFIFTIKCLANTSANSDLDARVKTLERRLSPDLSTPQLAPPVLREFANSHVYVVYPGAPGLQVDVFTENFKTLMQDFEVAPSQLLYRDSAGFHARYSQPATQNPRYRNPPGTKVLLDSEYLGGRGGCGLRPGSDSYIALQEAQFLNRVVDEFKKPLIVMCHSYFCRHMWLGIVAGLHGSKLASMIRAVFYIQGAEGPDKNVTNLLSNLNQSFYSNSSLPMPRGLASDQFRGGGTSNAPCSIQAPLTIPAGPSPLNPHVFFIADGSGSHNNFAPNNYGTYLGRLLVRHIDAVVSSAPDRSQRLPSYRRALTHTLIEIAYSQGKGK